EEGRHRQHLQPAPKDRAPGPRPPLPADARLPPGGPPGSPGNEPPSRPAAYRRERPGPPRATGTPPDDARDAARDQGDLAVCGGGNWRPPPPATRGGK